MSKKYRKKIEKEEEISDNETELSKKEQYDLMKRKKEEEKAKIRKKQEKKKKKKSTNSHQTNLAGRIFAVIMIILMIGSVVASIASYLS